jgi:NAD(P)-dependent dehydrogenase (short-subunit alcohol dehydrogenase family)
MYLLANRSSISGVLNSACQDTIGESYFAHEWTSKYLGHYEILLCAAVVLQVSCGFERTIASNFFGHFWLTQLLLDDLKAAAPSRLGQICFCLHAMQRRGCANHNAHASGGCAALEKWAPKGIPVLAGFCSNVNRCGVLVWLAASRHLMKCVPGPATLSSGINCC